MKKSIFAIILVAVTFLVGCEEFWQIGDELIQDANAVAAGTEIILESPVGTMIPPAWKFYGAVAVALINGVVITWQELRNRTMKKTTKAIVKGIENAENPDDITEVKTHIANEMQKQGGDKFYAKANKIVDRLKIS